MLTLFDSNRYEALTEALLDALAESASDGSPWRALSIIAPSAAIQRRLELEIAARFGICANIQFSYLAQWLWKQIGQVMNLSASNAFLSERLVWRCYRLLKARAWPICRGFPAGCAMRMRRCVTRSRNALRGSLTVICSIVPTGSTPGSADSPF